MAYQESRPFLLKLAEPVRQRDALVAASAKPAPLSVLESQYARRARAEICLSLLGSLRESGSETASQPEIARACLAMLETSLALRPLSSNDWFLAAYLAEQLGESDRAIRYLDRSYRSAPSEQWIAERRAVFAYRHRAELPDDLVSRMDDDFRLLLRTRRGLDVLARSYVRDRPMRDYLVTVAETLDEQSQIRFFEEIQRVAAPPGL